MQERNNPIKASSLVTEILLPSLFTLVILFCLAQVGLSLLGPGAGAQDAEEAPQKVTAISAFAS